MAVVDEGSEINVVDHDLVLKCGLQVEPVPGNGGATGAGSNPLKVVGQCKDDLVIDVELDGSSVPVQMGRAVVIKDLGTPCLLGEPAKADNAIRTIPEQRLIQRQDSLSAIHEADDQGHVQGGKGQGVHHLEPR